LRSIARIAAAATDMHLPRASLSTRLGAAAALPLALVALPLILVASLLGLGACTSDRSSASSGAGASGDRPIRILYVAYKSSQRLQLIDRSMSSSADYYSQTRKLEDAGTKVTSDEVLQETLDLFESKGFFDKAEHGAAPLSGENVYLQALEVETPGRVVHMSIHKATPPKDVQLFLECQKAFVTIYNGTYQLQSVDRAPDWNVQGGSPSKKKSDG
jgi:hypothetical protein